MNAHTMLAIAAPLARSAADEASTWIQVAKTGTFFSQRYGKLSITTDDLRSMLHNFRTVTPMPPTQLPVDFDHLSMAPKSVGDGRAARWIVALELRANETELWAKVEFTGTAAESIRKREYRFISPSFIKNYVYKNGVNIGTTLVAAALTNFPFLEGMAAVTLSAIHGQSRAVVQGSYAMEVGQRVAIRSEFLTDPSIADQPLEVIEIVGVGDDAFARLKTSMGIAVGWHRVTELVAAPAPDASTEMLSMARAEMTRTPGLELRDALRRVSLNNPSLAELARRDRVRCNLHVSEHTDDQADGFEVAVNERVARTGDTYAVAMARVAEARPDLAEQWRQRTGGRFRVYRD